LPLPKTSPKFLELYIFDTKNEIENRIRALTNEEPDEGDLNLDIVKQLKNMLDESNNLVKIFRHAHDLLEQHKGIDISIRIIGANKGDQIQYEMPHTEKLAILIVGDMSLENYKMDIIVSTHNNGLKHIFIFHPAYMALQYPLLFSYGERGFQLDIKYKEINNNRNRNRNNNNGNDNNNDSNKQNTVTIHEYYKYHMHYRPNEPNRFLCYGRLSKQAIVDVRAIEDEDRLDYIARN